MIECRVLGPPEVRVDGGSAPSELQWRKNLALIVYLARSPRRTRGRDHLIGLLWGDRPESAARHSLNEALRVLRRHLEEGALLTEGPNVRLAEGVVRLDVERFEKLLAREAWREAAALVGGVFMEGFGVPDAPGVEDWLAAERMTCTRASVACLARRAEELAAAGTLEPGVAEAERALRLDPLSGSAVRAWMRCRALAGDRSGALRGFEEFAARLAAELGLEPDPETLLLADRVRRERSWKLLAAVPREGATSRRAPLVGRERELAALLGAWSACRKRSEASAVYIGGEPGYGKSRLAEEFSARCRLQGATVVAIRAVRSDAEAPWSGVLALARGGLLEAPGIVVAPPAALAAFASRLSEWREPFREETAGVEPLGVGAALSTLLGAAVEEGPVLLVVDDAQWLDEESLGALAAALRDLQAAPFCLVAGAAPSPPRAELEELRARIGRDVPGISVHLGRLDADALASLARWALPTYGPREVERLVRRVEADSAGLPMLAVELLQAVALGLELRGEAEPWPAPSRTLEQTRPGELPDPVVAAIRIGFRRLGEPARRVLQAAAVLGERVPAEELGRAAGVEGEERDAALDELEWGRWLEAEPRGYAFVARLVREVVAVDLLTAGQAERIRRRAAGQE